MYCGEEGQLAQGIRTFYKVVSASICQRGAECELVLAWCEIGTFDITTAIRYLYGWLHMKARVGNLGLNLKVRGREQCGVRSIRQ